MDKRTDSNKFRLRRLIHGSRVCVGNACCLISRFLQYTHEDCYNMGPLWFMRPHCVNRCACITIYSYLIPFSYSKLNYLVIFNINHIFMRLNVVYFMRTFSFHFPCCFFHPFWGKYRMKMKKKILFYLYL